MKLPTLLRLPLLVPLAALLLTALATEFASRSVEAQRQSLFASEVENQLGRLSASVGAYTALLRATRAFVETQPGGIGARSFERYAESLRIGPDFPGIQGVGWSPRVDARRVAEFEQAARSEGLSDFAVWPAGRRDWMFSILYLEPLDARNRAALGFDMYSDPARAAAMARARDQGTLAMTSRVVLKQEIDEDKQAGFLIYVPLYQGGARPPTLEERRARLTGFVYAPFRARDFFGGLFDLPRASVAVRVHAVDAAGEPQLLYDGFPAAGSAAAHGSRRIDSRSETIGGQRWSIEFMALPSTDAPGALLPAAIALGGVTTAVLLFLLAYNQARARQASERRATESAEARAQTEEQKALLEVFLGVASHDLRNPLNVILLNAAMLERSEALPTGLRSGVARIKTSGSRAIRLVHDLLDYTRARLGRGMPVSPVTVDLCRVLLQIVEEYRQAHPGRDIVFEGRSETLGLWDADRLGQLVSNLLGNALAYGTPDTPVALRLTSSADEAVIAVHNQGEPIPADLREVLFEPLRQGPNRRGAAQGSIGLGLFIVEQIVRAHHGTLEVRSDGDGTSFVVRLPRSGPPEHGGGPGEPVLQALAR